MNKTTLSIAALISLVALIACSTKAQRTTAAPAPHTDTAVELRYMMDSLNAVYSARLDSLKTVYTTHAAQVYAPAATETADNAPAATICPATKTMRSGEVRTVYTGKRGGCYTLTASGNKSYFKP